MLATGPWRPRPWKAAFAIHADGRPVFAWPQVPDPLAVRYAVVWKPPPEAFAGLDNLAAIFSLGAGVDSIVGSIDLPDVPIVRFVSDDLTMRMTEWVVLQVLLHHRQQRSYDRQQADRFWQPLAQPAASSVRVGIMGLGELGQAAASACAMLGFQVAGWSRSRREVGGIQAYCGANELDAFLNRTDILVVLLPLTDATHGILNRRLFAKLARDGALGGPVLINAGRGGLQVEAELATALDDGTLIGASIDVFETEPLPLESPLWANPRLVITPHVAADTDPDVVARTILDQIARFEAGNAFKHVVDRQTGY